jgi:NTP pyrophosphatase (non-canonical NTP hydrolase)
MEKDKTIEQLLVELRKFTHERDWEQFHNGKDLALALSIEAAEVNQLFLWKSPENVNIEKLQDELADVLNYAFMLADKYNFDIESIMRNKMIKNGEKYPVEKAKGNAKKYNEF